MTALAAEVIWTRLLVAALRRDDLHVLADPRGVPRRPRHRQQLGSALARDVARPRVALGWCQLLLCARDRVGARTSLTQSLPYWPINPSISDDSVVQVPARSACAACGSVLPARDPVGRELPAGARRRSRRDGQDPARLVGGVYAANTVGAIVGALCASLLLVAWIGSQHAQQVLIVVSWSSGLLVLEPVGWRRSDGAATKAVGRRCPAWCWCAVMIAVGALLDRAACTQCRRCSSPTAATRRRASSQANEIIYVGEGMMASVAVSQLSNGVLNYHNAGKVQASSEPQDMRLQRMLGHLTTLLPPHGEDGAGHRLRRRRHGGRGVDRSARSRARPSPRSSRSCRRWCRRTSASTTSTSCETRRCTCRSTMRGTSADDEARSSTRVTSDPLDPWVKGAATLYTREFFEVVKDAPEPGRRRDAVRAALREQHRRR